MAAEREILELESFLPYRFNRLADAVSRDFARIYRDKYGLTRPEWRLLATLGQYGVMTATGIGEHSAMHKTKVSRAVAALEKRKWLVRDACPTDRRVEYLALSKTGAAAYRELVPLATGFEAKMLESLSEEDRGALLRGLEALERVLMPR
ncbi:MarR family transcriptional regulator [Aquamicrobium sp. LC103]|uniref:MarR family winged helix-turn-helix transcriptional regulator n=1 Tax=Aquamicrobium sp. LC103 TaxID=1120658 RepID=UPI00063EAA74|nr:MarR family transcriptional regulator [Aquamicrobium sp. LC103]TKT80945.1 MarR family transcriptional regulator [Aquamicrobium sp. LC103]